MNNSSNNTSISNSTENEDIDVLALVDVILDAKWLILIVTLLVFICAAAYAFLSTPIYQANSLIQVEKNQSSPNQAIGEMANLFNVESPSSAEMEILRSRLVVGRAADDLQLYIAAMPDYLPLIGRWLANYSVKPSNPMFGGFVTGSESIRIKLLEVPTSLEDKELNLVVTEKGYSLYTPAGNILVQGLIGKIENFDDAQSSGRLQVESLSAKPGARFILIRRSRLRLINSLQERLNLAELGSQSGMISATLTGTNPRKISDILNAIGRSYVNQNIERKAEEAKKTLIFLDDFLPDLKAKMQTSESAYTQFRDTHGTFNLGAEGQISLQASADLQRQLFELQQRRRELAPRFQPAHPAIKTLDVQIKAIEDQLGQIEKNIRKLPDVEQQLLSLMRNSQVNSEMYVNLLNSAQQLRLVKEGKVGNVRVIDTAVTAEEPIQPKRTLILVSALIFGACLGIIFALVRNWLRPGLTDSSQIESTLGLHVFATVPHSSLQKQLRTKLGDKSGRKHVLAAVSPDDPAIESLRGLRTALQFALLEVNNNVVMFTGPTPAIGKSFTSVNFAAILGSSNKRILLIDADLRKGYLNQYFDLERENGFSEMISGTISLSSAIHRDIMPNVDLITTGLLPPNPSELLMAPSTAKMIKSLSSDYDLVLLDTAPVLPVSDSAILAPLAGAVFLLAKENVTTLAEISETNKRLSQVGVKIRGIIFNDVIPNGRSYKNKYGQYRYTNYNYSSSNT